MCWVKWCCGSGGRSEPILVRFANFQDLANYAKRNYARLLAGRAIFADGARESGKFQIVQTILL